MSPRLALILAAVMLVNVASGCTAHKSSARPSPDIDMVLAAERRSTGTVIIGSVSNDIRDAYDVKVDGIPFIVCINQRTGEAKEVVTHSPTFTTPEGVRVGDTLDNTRRRGGDQPVTHPGFAHVVKLPSGWVAAFTTPGPNGPTDGRLSRTTRVAWLFYEIERKGS